MPQTVNDTEVLEDDEFDLSNLDLGELTVVSMHDSVALPESGASWKSSSTCNVITV